jgi:transposase
MAAPAILPARPYHPCDKAKAEVAVQIVQRWVLAALRKRQFFSLAELNEAINRDPEALTGGVAFGRPTSPE